MTLATEERIIKRTMIRDMPNRSRVIANLEVRIAAEGERFVGGVSPAFSLTGEIYEPHGNLAGSTRHKRYERMLEEGKNPGPASEPDISGCVHDEILRAFPDLEQFAAMHLSDPITGEPMHAEANGWYWYAGSRADLREQERFTGFDRIYRHQLDARGLRDGEAGRQSYCYLTACELLRVGPNEIPQDLDRAGFTAFVDAQRDRWRKEAEEAIAFIESLTRGRSMKRTSTLALLREAAEIVRSPYSRNRADLERVSDGLTNLADRVEAGTLLALVPKREEQAHD